MKGLIFTYLLTYGGAAASLWRPFIGLLIYVCFAIIRPESLWFWSVPPGNYSRIVAIALLIGWGLNGFGRWRFGAARAVVVSLLCYLGWAAVSASFAPNQAVGWRFVENTSKVVLPFLVGITVIDSMVKLKQLAWVIALSQGYVAYDLNQAYYDGFNRLMMVGFGSMDNNSQAIAMVTGAGLAFFLGMGERVWWRKLIAFAAAGLMAHCVMFSFSRGGMLGLIIVGAISFLLVPKTPRNCLAYAVALLVALRLAGPQVVDEFVTVFVDPGERDASSQSRIVMWNQCLGLMAANPLVGVGPDHFPLMARQLGWAGNKEAHTLWLQIGAELGLPGLGFLLAFYGICVWHLWPLRRDDPGRHPWISDSARMVISSLAGFAIAAQFVSLEGLEIPYYVNLLGAGTLRLASMSEYGGQTAIEDCPEDDYDIESPDERNDLSEAS